MTNTITPDDLANLRRLCEAAGAFGEWLSPTSLLSSGLNEDECAYIAALDPTTITKMLDLAEEALRLRETCQSCGERNPCGSMQTFGYCR